MTTKKPLKYRTLRRILSEFGIIEIKRRGKGSHRMFEGIVDGRGGLSDEVPQRG
jgi:hypothetical protein